MAQCRLASQKEDAEMRSYLDEMQKMVVGTATVLVDDQRCFYDILTKEFEPRLTHFVGAVDSSRGCYFVSEATPKEYQPLVVAHEHLCLMHKAKGRSHYCLQALREELTFIPDSMDWEAYIRFRRAFFDDFVKYGKGSTNTEFWRAVTESRDFLRSFNV